MEAHSVVNELCTRSDVLYSKTIYLTNSGLASLVQHVYGQQDWLPMKAKITHQNGKEGNGANQAVTAMFVLNTTQETLLSCKAGLERHFNLTHPSSAVHIPDVHDETVLLAQMVLNQNSVAYLNNNVGDLCKTVSTELAKRLKLPEAKPKVVRHSQDMMVDSHTVMSFFGLDKKPWTAQISLLFWNQIDGSILGTQGGIHVEAHIFDHNRHVSGIARDAPQILEATTINDFFVDPKYYGYCYGLKFAWTTRTAYIALN